jgi:adenylate kinase
MIIVLTGTPGVGKTYLARRVCKKLGWNHLEINKLVKREGLYIGYDKKLKSWIVDERKIISYVKKVVRGTDNIIIDSHLAHILPRSLVDKVIVLRCEPRVLEKRLKKRRYSKEKIRQNVESELIGLISYETKKRHKKLLEVDCSSGKLKCEKMLISIILGKTKKTKGIDWCGDVL